jgi:hypothetical protein
MEDVGANARTSSRQAALKVVSLLEKTYSVGLLLRSTQFGLPATKKKIFLVGLLNPRSSAEKSLLSYATTRLRDTTLR